MFTYAPQLAFMFAYAPQLTFMFYSHDDPSGSFLLLSPSPRRGQIPLSFHWASNVFKIVHLSRD